MRSEFLLQNFERIADAPDAATHLRRFILALAVRGKLLPQRPEDQPAKSILDDIAIKMALTTVAPVSATEVSYAIPNGWAWARLAHLAYIKMGQSPPAESYNTLGDGIPFYQGKADFGVNNPTPRYWCTAPMKIAKAGDILISVRAPVGPTNVANEDCCIGRGLTALRPYEGVDPEYFLLTLRAFEAQLAALGFGTTFVAINKSQLTTFCLPLAPLEEQHRIVAKVDELMTLCDQLEAAQKEGEFQRDELRAASLNRLTTTDDGARTDSDVRFFLNSSPRLITEPEHVLALRQAIYDLAVTGRLVTMNPSDEPVEGLSAHPSVDMSEQGSAAGVGALPVGWRNVTLGDITTLITSGSRGWAQYYADHGAIFVRSQNVKYGSLSTTDLAHVLPPASSEGRRTQVSVGDLLVVITGDVGHVGVWDTDLGEAYISQHVALVRPNSPELSPWLRLCLIAPSAGRQQLLSSIYGGKPGLNLKQVRMVWLPLAPLLEQQRIVARVDDLMVLCDHMESALASAQDERGRLLEALLREALNDARRNCYFGDAKFLEPAQQSMQ